MKVQIDVSDLPIVATHEHARDLFKAPTYQGFATEITFFGGQDSVTLWFEDASVLRETLKYLLEVVETNEGDLREKAEQTAANATECEHCHTWFDVRSARRHPDGRGRRCFGNVEAGAVLVTHEDVLVDLINAPGQSAFSKLQKGDVFQLDENDEKRVYKVVEPPRMRFDEHEERARLAVIAIRVSCEKHTWTMDRGRYKCSTCGDVATPEYQARCKHQWSPWISTDYNEHRLTGILHSRICSRCLLREDE